MLEQAYVPFIVKVAETGPALRRSKFHDVNIVAAARFVNGMKRLVDVADKVDQKLERVNPVLLGRILVGQHIAKHVDAVHYAIVMVSHAVRIFLIRLVTVARLGEAGG